ncbi:hypothetical protein TNIN_463831 [Trichonephila inaurata madagascariensis]|uniref:Uncharacterized protein n=1 Tax=Trichonephila inaurata madagascariensis TaxID=2747483 RepID=A0A8X7BZK2_9ARAC|nr:hypothetical protein TNIN_463831 [Trichonephila inaurata madagascariensis]
MEQNNPFLLRIIVHLLVMTCSGKEIDTESAPHFLTVDSSYSSHRRQEEEPMDWEDVPFLPEVSAPFFPSRPPRKMRSLISVQVSEPPSLSANRFPNMRALVPKVRTPQTPKVSVMSIVFNVVSPITSYFASFFI